MFSFLSKNVWPAAMRLPLSSVGELGDRGWLFIRRLTKNSKGDLLTTCPIGPYKVPVTFLVDTGAQMSALKVEDASSCGIIPSKKGLFVVGAAGHAQSQKIATVRCWLLGKKKVIETLTVLRHFPTDLLRLDLLKRKLQIDKEGKIWVFGKETHHRCCTNSFSFLCNQSVPLSLGSKYRSLQLLTT